MSYTPEEEKIEPVVENLLNNIKEYNSVVVARQTSGNYTEEHIKQIRKIRAKLFKIQVKLEKLIYR